MIFCAVLIGMFAPYALAMIPALVRKFGNWGDFFVIAIALLLAVSFVAAAAWYFFLCAIHATNASVDGEFVRIERFFSPTVLAAVNARWSEKRLPIFQFEAPGYRWGTLFSPPPSAFFVSDSPNGSNAFAQLITRARNSESP
jgi:hypothetical protein